MTPAEMERRLEVILVLSGLEDTPFTLDDDVMPVLIAAHFVGIGLRVTVWDDGLIWVRYPNHVEFTCVQDAVAHIRRLL